MTSHEQKMFNEHANKAHSLGEQLRIQAKLHSKLTQLTWSERHALLRKIETLL